MLMAPSGATVAQAGRADSPELAKLKAAYVLNFARFTAWPDEAFEDRASPIVVGVAGDDAVGAYLETLVEEENVGGRRIVVRRIDISALESGAAGGARSALAARLRDLHVFFIGGTTARRASWLLDRLEDRRVLTVSDLDRFAERGGMIGLVLRNRRLAFDANVDQMRRHRVSVSSQVLRLARIVGEGSS